MPARTAGTPHHPDLISHGGPPLIPAGENRMSMDIMNFDDPREGGTGRTTGYMYLPGYSGGSDGDPYVWQEQPGGPWHVNSLPGDVPEQSAATPQKLMEKIARLFNVHGEMKVEDERENASRNLSGTRTLAPAPTGPKQRQASTPTPATPARASIATSTTAVPFTTGLQQRENADGSITVGGLREDQRWVTPAGLTVMNPSQNDIIQGRVKLVTRPAPTGTGTGDPAVIARVAGLQVDRSLPIGSERRRAQVAIVGHPDKATMRQVDEAFGPERPGTGPGVVPVGATDADRQAARPRKEGESDQAYAVRTAPTREAALSLLNGHQAAGLRAIARAEGVVTSGSKADLVARLIRVMRDRHEDSDAITRMVNRASGTAAPETVTSPRTNAPATSGSITPTMTGSQLLAARRKLAAEQQGASRPKV